MTSALRHPGICSSPTIQSEGRIGKGGWDSVMGRRFGEGSGEGMG